MTMSLVRCSLSCSYPHRPNTLLLVISVPRPTHQSTSDVAGQLHATTATRVWLVTITSATCHTATTACTPQSATVASTPGRTSTQITNNNSQRTSSLQEIAYRTEIVAPIRVTRHAYKTLNTHGQTHPSIGQCRRISVVITAITRHMR